MTSEPDSTPRRRPPTIDLTATEVDAKKPAAAQEPAATSASSEGSSSQQAGASAPGRPRSPVKTAVAGIAAGLVPALQWQAREVSKRSGLWVTVDAASVSEDLPEEHNRVTLDPVLKDSSGIPAPAPSQPVFSAAMRAISARTQVPTAKYAPLSRNIGPAKISAAAAVQSVAIGSNAALFVHGDATIKQVFRDGQNVTTDCSAPLPSCARIRTPQC